MKLIPRHIFYFGRLILIGLFLAISMLQLLSFPGQFRNEASVGGASQTSRWFLTIMVGIWFFMAQIAIVALWKTLSLIYLNELVSETGLKWVNLIVRTLGAAALYGAGITIIAIIATKEPGPGVIVASVTTFISALFVVSYFFRHQIFSVKG